ncbi:MAG: hypothetical protein MUP58_01745 [Candidatus Nanohaloarchaeota archaeon QJJ-9]|nr:hypothetical protein [Candidatus Nanohaloarchaeota archaeon QJJ-9]
MFNREEFDVREAAVIGLTSVIAFLGVYLSPVTMENILNLRIDSILQPSLAFLALLILPSTYASYISTERFRAESFASFVVIPAAFLGGLVVVAIAIPLGTLFASYKSRSVFNGKNYFWTYFKSGAAIVTMLALVGGLYAGLTIMNDASTRGKVRDAVSEEVTDTALETVNESFTGSTGSILAQQKDYIVGLSTRLAENTSRSSIIATGKLVMANVNGSGSFSDSQKALLGNSFSKAESSIPERLSNEINTRIEAEMDERLKEARPDQSEMVDVVESRVSKALDPLFGNKRLLGVVSFLVVASIILLFRIPAEILAGWTGYLIKTLRSN